MRASNRKALALSFIPLIIVAGLFGLYISLSPVCQQYSCVHVLLNSETSVNGTILVYLTPVSAECATGPLICTFGGVDCSLPSNFCYSVKTQPNTFNFVFQGVNQGYYALGWTQFFGNFSSGFGSYVHLANQTAYFVTVNIPSNVTASPFASISITPNANVTHNMSGF